jgi:aspartate dehydrogenase
MSWVGLIGCGGIAQDVLAALRSEDTPSSVRIVGALARPGRSDIARQNLPDVDIVETLEELLESRPDLIAEVASQQAVADYGEAVLGSRIDLLVISVGALADSALYDRRTQVELVADPDAPGNVHEIEAEGIAGGFAIQLQGKPSRTNPKTSALAALSVARALQNEQATIVI